MYPRRRQGTSARVQSTPPGYIGRTDRHDVTGSRGRGLLFKAQRDIDQQKSHTSKHVDVHQRLGLRWNSNDFRLTARDYSSDSRPREGLCFVPFT